jgi:hypothetical protein
MELLGGRHYERVGHRDSESVANPGAFLSNFRVDIDDFVLVRYGIHSQLGSRLIFAGKRQFEYLIYCDR